MEIDVFSQLRSNCLLLSFSAIGMVVGVRFLPRLVGLDLPSGAARLARQRGLGAFAGTLMMVLQP